MTIKKLLKKDDLKSSKKARVAIIVPYRDQIEENRKMQLKIFIKHFNKFLKDYDLWKIFIIKQTFDNNKFNRGKLLNVGFKLAEKEGFNTFIFHDVDLLPVDTMLKLYTTYPENPIHIGSLWKIKYNYSTFVGGAISINIDDYKLINGFPNIFWGWGGEDDALYFRLMINKINILEPQIKDWGKIYEMQHGWNPDEGNEKKKANRNFDKYNWRKNGLNNLNYKITKEKKYDKNVIKIYVNLGKPSIFNYQLNYDNIAKNKQDMKNLIINPRIYNKVNNYEIFKNTIKFLIKNYQQGTYVLIKNNELKIFSSFNFNKENYLNTILITKYYHSIIELLKKKKINNNEFFINTLPLSILFDKAKKYLPIVRDIIEENSLDQKIELVLL